MTKKGYKESNLNFFREKNELHINTEHITCSSLTLQIDCHVGERPFAFSSPAETSCSFVETIG